MRISFSVKTEMKLIYVFKRSWVNHSPKKQMALIWQPIYSCSDHEHRGVLNKELLEKFIFI